jgi:catechol 2,3-dioxygenase-like lactoylglutathione lyase family enzyme
MTELRNLKGLSREAPITPMKFGHVVLRTSDMPRLRDWYLHVLNGHVSYQNDQVSFLTYDDEHHRVGIVQIPGVATSNGLDAGLEHLSFTYRDLGALLATYQRLKSSYIEPFWSINHGPTISMYYRDPDANKVELQVDVFRTIEETNAFLDRYYPENFMGIIFDPEQMIRDYERGMPLEDLYRRPPLPPGKTPWDMHRA